MNYQKFQDDAQEFGQKVAQKATNVAAGLKGKKNQNLVSATDAEYDADSIPPSIELAFVHQDATLVGPVKKKKDQSRTKVCPCCTRPVERTPIKINCNDKDYSFLGAGMTLYFEFIKANIVILLVIFVTSGDFNFFTNALYGHNCQPIKNPEETNDKNYCIKTWVTVISLANKRGAKILIEIQQLLNLVTIIVLIVALMVFRKQQREIDIEIDEQHFFSSDYTILVKNIPLGADNLKNNDYDEDLKDYFNKYLEGIPQDEKIVKLEDDRMKLVKGYQRKPRIVNVNLAYKLSEQLDIEKDKKAAIAQKQKALAELYSQGVDPQDESLKVVIEKDGNKINKIIKNPAISDIQNQINEYEHKLEMLEEKYYDGKDVKDAFLGMALVTFSWEYDRDQVLLKNSTTSWQRFRGKKSELEYRGNVLVIEEPPEPTDIFWENLHVTTKEKIKRRTIGYIITGIMLAICTAAIYLITQYQKHITDENAQEKAEGKTTSNIEVKVMAYVASILITTINFLLAKFIGWVTNYESFSTQTGFQSSLATKSGLAQFCNTALITFLISQFIVKNTYGNGGLIYNQTYVFLTNTVVPALFQLINVPVRMKQFFRWFKFSRKGNQCTLTQQELNDLYENPPFIMAVSYAMILKNMYVTAFYASIIPAGLIINCFGLYIHYWVEKYQIARTRTIKHNYDSKLSLEMTESLELVLPIYCITNFYWEYDFSHGKSISVYAIVGIVLGVLNAVLPMQWINEKLFPMKETPGEILPFSDVEEFFITDYPRENPATMERERENYYQRIKAQHQAQEAAKNMTQALF